MARPAVARVLDKTKAEWKYNAKDYDARLAPALLDFEYGQYEAGMKALAPLKQGKTKTAKSAVQLYGEIKKEGEAWKEEADQAGEEKPIKAYDLYTRVARVFKGDALAKEVAAPLKKLKTNKTVLKELEGRKEMAAFEARLSAMPPAQRPAALAECKKLAKKFAGTPTGDQAQSLVVELGGK
jgi:hypothetical protein